VIAGVGHLRHKECDRLSVLEDGLRKVGVPVRIDGDMIRVTGADPIDLVGASLDPSNDHRMAMAFSLLGLRIPGVVVTNVDCAGKSDPEFFTRLTSLLGEER